jgi:parallel beta-helix repeat protein
VETKSKRFDKGKWAFIIVLILMGSFIGNVLATLTPTVDNLKIQNRDIFGNYYYLGDGLTNVTSRLMGDWGATPITTTGNVTAANFTTAGAVDAYSLYVNGEKYYPESEASYVMWVDGATYYAKNGHTGQVTSNVNAVTLINSLSGDVYIKSGLYNITSAILPGNNAKIEGAGWSTILKAKNGFTDKAVILVDGKANVTIANLQINGNKANQVAVGDDEYQDGIKCESYAHRVLIENCYVHDCKYIGFLISTLDGPCNDIVTSNCWGNSNADDGFHCHGGYDLKYIGCTADSNTNQGFYFYATYRTQLDSCTAKDNGSSGFEIQGASYDMELNSCVSTGAAVNNAIFLYQASKINIENCIVTHAGGWGIHLEQSNYSTIKGCQINNIMFYGVLIEGSSNNIIEGNEIIDVGLTGTNTIDSIYLKTEVNPSTYNTIINNIMIATGGTKSRYGIYEVDANQNYNIILGNRISTMGTGAINSLGINDIVHYNIGFITENSGTATLLNTAASIYVPHGCSFTPTAQQITITYTENPTNAATYWYVGNCSATGFTLYHNDPGASNLDFGWNLLKIP